MVHGPKIKVFLDTSALVAGIVSAEGAARAVLQLAEIGLIELIVSRQVVVEADRTFEAKIPEMAAEYRDYMGALAPVMKDDPPPGEVEKACKIINRNDAPILSAALLSGADYLATWDKKHFIGKKMRFKNLKIVTPGEFLHEFRMSIEPRS